MDNIEAIKLAVHLMDAGKEKQVEKLKKDISKNATCRDDRVTAVIVDAMRYIYDNPQLSALKFCRLQGVQEPITGETTEIMVWAQVEYIFAVINCGFLDNVAPLIEVSYQVCVQRYGEGDIKSLLYLWSHVYVQVMLEHYDKATELCPFEDALMRFENCPDFGAEDPTTISFRDFIAQYHTHEEHYNDAIMMYERNIACKKLKPEHPDVYLADLRRLASVYVLIDDMGTYKSIKSRIVEEFDTTDEKETQAISYYAFGSTDKLNDTECNYFFVY